jgi:HD superfamily phosphodiesterase
MTFIRLFLQSFHSFKHFQNKALKIKISKNINVQEPLQIKTCF